jgi:hypothetical protein
MTTPRPVRIVHVRSSGRWSITCGCGKSSLLAAEWERVATVRRALIRRHIERHPRCHHVPVAELEALALNIRSPRDVA